jgi:hypothetical protein
MNDTDGWEFLVDEHGHYAVNNGEGRAVAHGTTARNARQIVADHRSAAAVPKLVQALKEARALIGSTDELARLISQAPVLKLIDEALTTVQGKEQG